jgi:hypothetical protein
MSILLSAVFLLATAQAPAAAAPDWSETTSNDGKFTFAMPGKAKALNQTVPSPNGPIEQTVYYLKLDGALYTVQGIALADEIPENVKQAALDRERDEYVRNYGGKQLKLERVSLDGSPGWDFTLEGPAPGGGAIVISRTRIYLLDRTYCMTTIMSANDQPLPPEAGRFLDSFRFGRVKAKTDVAAATPVQALRTFQIALITKDEATLRAVTLAADDFGRLLEGEGVPADKTDVIRATAERQPIRTLKAGDEINVPGSGKSKVQPAEVTDERAVLLPEGAPMPIRLKKVDGRWRVDARPMIAGRKAAEAARKKSAKPGP